MILTYFIDRDSFDHKKTLKVMTTRQQWSSDDDDDAVNRLWNGHWSSGLFPTYFLHMEREEGRAPVFLLAGRKRKKWDSSSASLLSSSSHLKLAHTMIISTNPIIISKKNMLAGVLPPPTCYPQTPQTCQRIVLSPGDNNHLIRCIKIIVTLLWSFRCEKNTEMR